MASDMMEMDIDIDLGILDEDDIQGMGVVGTEFPLVTQPVLSEILANHAAGSRAASEPDARILDATKVHLHGLDNLTSKDLEALARAYSTQAFQRIEWIDDSSANLVYGSDEAAAGVLKAVAAIEIGDVAQLPVGRLIPAKAFPGHPETSLQIRLAVRSDKKQPHAHERSRFYLIHPEHDPASRRGYRKRDPLARRPFDDPKAHGKRHYKRALEELDDTFNESNYDDDESSLSSRAKLGVGRPSSRASCSSGDGTRARASRGGRRTELFPDRPGRGRLAGRLRERSASPARDDDTDMPDVSPHCDTQKENRRTARSSKSSGPSQRAHVAKELFPPSTHPRRDPSTDLSRRMTRPAPAAGHHDAAAERRPGRPGGVGARGPARAPSSAGFAIKGAAAAQQDLGLGQARGRNVGKELLGGALERRMSKRRAEDLFG